MVPKTLFVFPIFWLILIFSLLSIDGLIFLSSLRSSDFSRLWFWSWVLNTSVFLNTFSAGVRRFDKSLATIPNFQFAENAVINNTQTTNRRINWMIGLEYRTTSEQLKNIKKEIEDYIKKSDDFVKSEDTLLSVKIDQFAASSIDIRLICFTKTKYFQEWLNVKDTLALEIKNIVEKNKASFAFPSTSVYVEKNSWSQF